MGKSTGVHAPGHHATDRATDAELDEFGAIVEKLIEQGVTQRQEADASVGEGSRDEHRRAAPRFGGDWAM
jgi:hypothetical protein